MTTIEIVAAAIGGALSTAAVLEYVLLVVLAHPKSPYKVERLREIAEILRLLNARKPLSRGEQEAEASGRKESTVRADQ